MSNKKPNPTDAAKRREAEPAAEAKQAAGAAAAGQTPAPPPAESQPAQPEDELNHDIELLRTELDEAKDRALRFQAELDNYRKRVNRQMEEDRRYAHLALVRDLLPVLDNARRAIEAAGKAADAASLLEGFKMVARQLQGVLERHHCTKIEALHQPFDPHLHEAICQQPSTEFPPNTVLCVAQGGFRMHDRVVRPSQVIVSVAPPEAEAAPAAPSKSDGDAAEDSEK